MPKADRRDRSAAAPAQGRPPMPRRPRPRRATDDELAALEALGKEGLWRVGSDELKLTNLDKPLFEPREPDDGEPDHEARADPLLRAHRPDDAAPPRTTGRSTSSASRTAPAPPASGRRTSPRPRRSGCTRWHETGVDGREDRDANDHLIADSVASLCWLGNQASFEIHAWTGRLPDPWRPTFAYIDIDPGEKTTWDETLVLARLYRTALEHLGVRGYPKTTGKRGIQIWIPIDPRPLRLLRHQRVGREGQPRRRLDGPGPDLLGVGEAGAQGPRPARLHPERAHQDAGRAVQRPSGRRRAGLDADHVGRARRPRPSPGPLDGARRSSSAWPRWATSSRPPRPTPRSCRPSDDGP